jgi:phosphate-selective porin OprO/OprP
MVLNGLKGVRKYCVSACVVLAAAAGTARADDTAELRQLLDMQSRQIEQLKQRLDAQQQQPVNAGADQAGDAGVKKIVDDYLMEKDAQKKAAADAAKKKEEDEGYKVGTDLGGSVRWNGFGWQFQTPHNDFVYHVGARIQDDWVWFAQNNVSRAPTQLGDLQDGTFFRRIRLNFDGTAWEVCEFNFEILLDQIRQGIIGMDEVYVGLKEIPFIGTFRVGNFHVPQGLEGDMYSSSKAMTFMERSAITDAIFEGENLMPGVLATNSFFCQHMTYAAWAGRQTTFLHDSTGADFGDGQYAFIGRLTALPIYEDDGRYLVHLGSSVKWAKAPKEDPTSQNGYPVPNISSFRLRARPELRDAIGNYGRADVQTAVTNNFLPGNDSIRLTDTGSIACSSETVVDFEFLGIAGPFSLQAEYAVIGVNGAKGTLAAAAPQTVNAAGVGVAATPGTLTPFAGGGERTLYFEGGYVQLAYTLTGENRGYDRRFGKLFSNYFQNIYSPFWATKREGGGWNLGRGAWEVALRYDWLDLDDKQVRGGIQEDWTIGLNWYLNNNFKFQFDYIHDLRYDKGAPPPGSVTGGGGNIPTNVNGFGIRTQMFF